MTKTKTYWAVFTGRGNVAEDVCGCPIIYTKRSDAVVGSLWLVRERGDKKATVRKVQIVEVGK